MAKAYKLPKTINGFRLHKPLRKEANKLIARLQGEELQALISAVLAAAVVHVVDRGSGGAKPLLKRLAGAVESHLKH